MTNPNNNRRVRRDNMQNFDPVNNRQDIIDDLEEELVEKENEKQNRTLLVAVSLILILGLVTLGVLSYIYGWFGLGGDTDETVVEDTEVVLETEVETETATATDQTETETITEDVLPEDDVAVDTEPMPVAPEGELPPPPAPEEENPIDPAAPGVEDAPVPAPAPIPAPAPDMEIPPAPAPSPVAPPSL